MKILSLILIICCNFKKCKCNFFVESLRFLGGRFAEGSGLGSSSRNSKISKQINNDYEYSDKNKLLNSQINNMILGMEPIVNVLLPFSYHFFALLETNKGGILIEYGQYHKNNDGNDFYHYYYGDEGGVRFKKMSYDNFEKKSILKIIPLSIERKMTLETLLEKVSSIMPLKFRDYNFADNNCQDFIKNVIYVLCAKWPSSKKWIENLISSWNIPYIILEKIIYNEENGCYGEGGKDPDFFQKFQNFVMSPFANLGQVGLEHPLF